MINDSNCIDVDKLRKDMRDDCLGAYFGGGYGAALIESIDLDKASDVELLNMAKQHGVNLNNYHK